MRMNLFELASALRRYSAASESVFSERFPLIINHLWSNSIVFAPLGRVRGTICRGGVRELAGEDQTRGFVQHLPGGFQQRGQRLVGAGGVHRHQVVVGFHRVGGNETRLGRLARHIAGGGGR